jgi:iron-sulfur cluster repair protein YtfE (RIC family)
MNAVDRLRRDHAILRSKLATLDFALSAGPEAWFVLREACFSLSRQLRDHMKREEDLVTRCRQAMPPHVLAEIAVEHKDEPKHWRALNRMFVSQEGHSLDRIRPALQEVIRGLRQHMVEEERDLFPLFERFLTQEAPARAAAAASSTGIDETMTVNRVVRQFPGTRPVFEELFINLPMEGCTCLDEVAWRHGMEASHLIQQLEKAIRPRRPGWLAAEKEGSADGHQRAAVAGSRPAA